MLAKEDKKEVGEIMTEKLGEFFERVLAPYLDAESKQNQKEHQEIKEEVSSKVADLSEYIKDHEERIRKLEAVTRTN